MRDCDFGGSRRTAAGGINSRSAYRPVHGWLSGAGGTPSGEVSSSGPSEIKSCIERTESDTMDHCQLLAHLVIDVHGGGVWCCNSSTCRIEVGC